MVRQYRSFVIRVGRRKGDHYPITAEFEGASWSDEALRQLGLTDEEMKEASAWLDSGRIDFGYLQDLGGRLFEALVHGDILKGFTEVHERVAQQGDQGGLRIVLELPSALAGLPWELMYDEKGGLGFLARRPDTPVVRHLPVPVLPNRPPVEGPLRILLIAASPQLGALSSEQEAQEIERQLSKSRLNLWGGLRLAARHLKRTRSLRGLLRRLRGRTLVQIDFVMQATEDRLRQWMEDHVGEAGYHVVHFVGHGYAGKQGGGVYLIGGRGQASPVPAAKFTEMIRQPTLNLVVLNACQTGAVGDLTGVMQVMLKNRVPATLGMQVSVLDRLAVEFAREFYGAWASGEPLEGALAWARRLLGRQTRGAEGDWGIPVLYMGPTQPLTLQMELPPLTLPAPVRAVGSAAGRLLALLSLVGFLLLEVPAINRAVRTQVPVIRCKWPYPMSSEHNFNLAVAEFTVLDEEGRPVSSSEGRALANFLFERLQFSFEEFNLGIPYELRPPAYTCPIQGSSSDDRARSAAALAERLRAHVVIYGTVTQAGDRSRFAPEFYVNYKGFEEGGDVVGPHVLGSDLYLELPFDAKQYQGVRTLAPSERIKALTFLSVGLSCYFSDDPQGALNYFQQAAATTGWSPLDRSKAVVYQFLGNAAARLFTVDQRPEYLGQADQYFSTALSIDPSYTRAKLGEAGVLYLRALTESTDRSAYLANLDAAAATYQAALSLGEQPDSANIATKVHYGLGQVYYRRGEELGEEWLARAESEFQQVVDEYHVVGNDTVKYLAGSAHARLGQIELLRNDLQAAIEQYEQAIALVSPLRQAGYYGQKGELHYAAGHLDLAVEAYEQAVRKAVLYCDDQSAIKYAERLVQLKGLQEHESGSVSGGSDHE